MNMKLKSLSLICFFTLATVPSIAFASNCNLTINSNDRMQFDTKELQIDKSCEIVNITLNHTGSLPKSAMGHNLVISKTSDMKEINDRAIKAGVQNEYLDPNDDSVIIATKMLGGGESDTISFSPKKITDGEFSFFCTFPGHYALMQGKVKIN